MTAKDKRILVVEDDPNSLQILLEALGGEGYQLESATSAAEGLALVKKFKPHLVVSDHDMPGGTGLDMLQTLRQQKNYVTLIFVSGRGDVGLVAKALRAGADDYIRKPFRVEELLARVECSLRNNEARRDLLEANQRLQEMVDRDYLTGLLNMRSLYERIDLELKRHRRFGGECSCVMIDMDHFKRVNDSFDHLFGSFVLKEMGKIIQDTIRDTDLAARYGGDEFLLVLVETGPEGAEVLAERLRQKVADRLFVDGKDQIQLTVSIGLASSSLDPSMDARKLVRFADHALYESKAKGRNCWTSYVGPLTDQKTKSE